ncbi:MAG: zf-HC2 domain-containing protein [Candidatus Kryptoniota bacterium]
MDCRESRELMTGAVDNELSKEQSAEFFEHIEICSECRDEYELEKLTKAYIKRKITWVEVPYELQQAILIQINSSGNAGHTFNLWSSLLSNSFFQPLLAFGVVVLIAITLFVLNRSNTLIESGGHPSSVSLKAENMDALSAAENNFQSVLSGTMKPKITSKAISDVLAYLKEKVGYSVYIPSIPNVDWVGATITDGDNRPIVHVIYKMGDTYVYILAFPKEYLDARVLRLPLGCIKSISGENWYWTYDSNGDLQAVWAHNSNICVATANMERNELLSLLSSKSYHR